jgi:Transcriptional regulator, AbiEi antitoxin
MRPKVPPGDRQRRMVGVVDALGVWRQGGRLASRQHGVITREQLGLGASPEQVQRRLRAGRLRRLHRGVYLVGAVAPERAFEHAAVLACGDCAYASHHTAATLYNLPLPDRPTAVHVTVLNRDVRRPGITATEREPCRASETQLLDGIPTTSPGRERSSTSPASPSRPTSSTCWPRPTRRSGSPGPRCSPWSLFARPGPVSER